MTRQQAAIEAVARQVSAAWESGQGEGPAAWLTVAGERIAVDVVPIAPPAREPAKPRLRFDRVVVRLVARLHAALAAILPDGVAVIVTVTAPIRLPGKTEAAIIARVRGRSGDVRETIHGNDVRIRIVADVPGPIRKLVGFVHNPESDPGLVIERTEALLREVGAAAERRLPGPAGARWLVLTDAEGGLFLEAYREIIAQLAPAVFDRVLIVLAGDRVETLA